MNTIISYQCCANTRLQYVNDFTIILRGCYWNNSKCSLSVCFGLIWTNWVLDAIRRDLIHATQEPMAQNSVSILILKHRHGLVTDCHRLPIVTCVVMSTSCLPHCLHPGTRILLIILVPATSYLRKRRCTMTAGIGMLDEACCWLQSNQKIWTFWNIWRT